MLTWPRRVLGEQKDTTKKALATWKKRVRGGASPSRQDWPWSKASNVEFMCNIVALLIASMVCVHKYVSGKQIWQGSTNPQTAFVGRALKATSVCTCMCSSSMLMCS